MYIWDKSGWADRLSLQAAPQAGSEERDPVLVSVSPPEPGFCTAPPTPCSLQAAELQSQPLPPGPPSPRGRSSLTVICFTSSSASSWEESPAARESGRCLQPWRSPQLPRPQAGVSGNSPSRHRWLDKSVLLSWGQFCPPGVTWECRKTFPVVSAPHIHWEREGRCSVPWNPSPCSFSHDQPIPPRCRQKGKATRAHPHWPPPSPGAWRPPYPGRRSWAAAAGCRGGASGAAHLAEEEGLGPDPGNCGQPTQLGSWQSQRALDSPKGLSPPPSHLPPLL